MISLNVKETWNMNDIESQGNINITENYTSHSSHSFCSFRCPVRVKDKPQCMLQFSIERNRYAA